MVDIAREYANDPHMRTVQLGVDTVHFISKDKVGKYLIERAHKDRIEALEALASIRHNDSEQILALQWQAKIPDLFLRWLDEAISASIAAEEQIVLEEEMNG